MKLRRVKITGIGPVTPAGVGREAFWKGILEPVSRVRPYPILGDEWGPFVAAWVDNLNLKEIVEPFPSQKNIARHTALGVAAAALAVKDAGVSLDELRTKRTAVVTGTSIMDFGAITRETESVFKRGLRGIQPRLVFISSVAHVAATIGEALRIDSHNMALQSSCCSGLDAVGHAARMVATGEFDFAICGGTEAPLFKHPLLEFRALGMTPSTVERPGQLNRPFDLWRTTGVVSEGACLLLIEPDSSPRPGYGCITGYAFANDRMNELCGGMAPAMECALQDARIRPREIDVVNAWGPGHRLIDAAEANEMEKVFGEHLPSIATCSIKGSIGNPLGGASAIQIGAAALGLREGVVPPTVNWEFPDPACPLNLSSRPRFFAHRRAIINAHGVAGTNASLVIERC